jgi:hypothetical protein
LLKSYFDLGMSYELNSNFGPFLNMVRKVILEKIDLGYEAWLGSLG